MKNILRKILAIIISLFVFGLMNAILPSALMLFVSAITAFIIYSKISGKKVVWFKHNK